MCLYRLGVYLYTVRHFKIYTHVKIALSFCFVAVVVVVVFTFFDLIHKKVSNSK